MPSLDRIEYMELEREWIILNNIHVGDRVFVTRNANNYERGWDNSWDTGMDSFVGNEYHITSLNRTNGSGISLNGMYSFPYFVLEKIDNEDSSSEPRHSLHIDGFLFDISEREYQILTEIYPIPD